MNTHRTEVTTGLLSSALRRYGVLILIPIILLAGLAYFVGESGTDVYQSSARVLLKPVPGMPLSPDAGSSSNQMTIALTTEAQLVTSTDVSNLANKELKTPIVPGDGTVASSVQPNSTVIQVSYRADTPEQAQAGVGILVKSFLDYRASIATAVQKGKIDALTAQANTVKGQLDAASKAAAAAVPVPEAAGQVQLYSGELVTLQSSITQAQGVSLDPGQVVSAPSVPDKPAGLSSMMDAAAGGVVGLLVGLVLALWREVSYRRVRAGAISVGGLPVLGSVSSRRRLRRNRATGRRGAVIDELRGAVLAGTTMPALVAVAPVGAEPASSGTAYELAGSLAAAGYRTTLVVASAGISLPSGMPTNPGLAELLLSGSAPERYLTSTGLLHVLPLGEIADEDSDLLGGPRMQRVLEELRQQNDVIVLATPSLSTPLGFAVARFADVVVALSTARHTRTDEVVDVVRQSDLMGLPLLGIAILGKDGWAGKSASAGSSLLGHLHQVPVSTVADDAPPDGAPFDAAADDTEASKVGTGTSSNT